MDISGHNRAVIRSLSKKRHDEYDSMDVDRWFMNKTHVMDTLLPPYNPLYDELECYYSDEPNSKIHAIADWLIETISFHSLVYMTNVLEDPFEKANRHFFSGYGMKQVIKPEVQAEIVKIIAEKWPVKFFPKQSAFRACIGLKYKERFEW